MGGLASGEGTRRSYWSWSGAGAALGVSRPSPASGDRMGSRFSNALQVLERHAWERVAEGRHMALLGRFPRSPPGRQALPFGKVGSIMVKGKGYRERYLGLRMASVLRCWPPNGSRTPESHDGTDRDGFRQADCRGSSPLAPIQSHLRPPDRVVSRLWWKMSGATSGAALDMRTPHSLGAGGVTESLQWPVPAATAGS